VIAVVLWYQHRSHRLRVKEKRRAAYDACLDRFENYQIKQDDINFPELHGHYRNYEIDLKLVADHVGYRKVPSLWLLVSVYSPLPYKGILDFMVRPQNIEFFSPYIRLDHDLPIPTGWPAYALLRSDNPDQTPPLHLLDDAMTLFDEPKMKELLITPKGVRLVYQIDQAKRREYLVLRSVDFEDSGLDPELVCGLLDNAIEIHTQLNFTTTTAEPVAVAAK
jgi:hypothetical protein